MNKHNLECVLHAKQLIVFICNSEVKSLKITRAPLEINMYTYSDDLDDIKEVEIRSSLFKSDKNMLKVNIKFYRKCHKDYDILLDTFEYKQDDVDKITFKTIEEETRYNDLVSQLNSFVIEFQKFKGL